MTTTETTETTKTETQIVTQDPDDEVEVEAILKPIYTKEVRQAIQDNSTHYQKGNSACYHKASSNHY